MKIAVTYENGEVFQHFGHTKQFKIYSVENGTVVDSQIIETNGAGHGALADFLKNNGVTSLICGGIGGGAKAALKEANIVFYGGVKAQADAAVEALLKGNLQFNPNVECSHHGHGENHSCGSHSCHSQEEKPAMPKVGINL